MWREICCSFFFLCFRNSSTPLPRWSNDILLDNLQVVNVQSNSKSTAVPAWTLTSENASSGSVQASADLCESSTADQLRIASTDLWPQAAFTLMKMHANVEARAKHERGHVSKQFWCHPGSRRATVHLSWRLVGFHAHYAALVYSTDPICKNKLTLEKQQQSFSRFFLP